MVVIGRLPVLWLRLIYIEFFACEIHQNFVCDACACLCMYFILFIKLLAWNTHTFRIFQGSEAHCIAISESRSIDFKRNFYATQGNQYAFHSCENRVFVCECLRVNKTHSPCYSRMSNQSECNADSAVKRYICIHADAYLWSYDLQEFFFRSVGRLERNEICSVLHSVSIMCMCYKVISFAISCDRIRIVNRSNQHSRICERTRVRSKWRWERCKICIALAIGAQLFVPNIFMFYLQSNVVNL